MKLGYTRISCNRGIQNFSKRQIKLKEVDGGEAGIHQDFVKTNPHKDFSY